MVRGKGRVFVLVIPDSYLLLLSPYIYIAGQIWNRSGGPAPDGHEGDSSVFLKRTMPVDPSAYSKSPIIIPAANTGFYLSLPYSFRTLVDLFAGGCDVCSNIRADRVRANDINPYVIGIYQAFQKMEMEELLDYIRRTIEENRLSISSQEAYSRFRKKYNESPEKNPLDLYILVCYAFNYQFRFNSRHGFNSPFGRNRSSFNPSIRENLIRFHKRIREIEFSALDFREFPAEDLGRGDFVYADPPCLIATGSYNDGKRGFKGWSGKC